jgi:Ca-activated chloride channel family protein
MRRLLATSTAYQPFVIPKIIQILAATLAAMVLIVGFAAQASAQTQAPGCSAGLMRVREAGTGTLLLKTTTPGCYLPAPRVAADISVGVAGPIARTRVTQRFENPSEGWVEGIYVFPLPETAAVDTLKMQIGDRLIEGEIKERREASSTGPRPMRSASLREEERPNLTQFRRQYRPHVMPSWCRSNIRVVTLDAGRFHLRVPLVVAPRYSPDRLWSLSGWAAAHWANFRSRS